MTAEELFDKMFIKLDDSKEDYDFIITNKDFKERMCLFASRYCDMKIQEVQEKSYKEVAWEIKSNTIEPTMRFRWFESKHDMIIGNPNSVVVSRKLQQYFKFSNGEGEWRDVETIKAE